MLDSSWDMKKWILCPEVIYQPAQVLDRIKSLRTHRNYPGEVESGTPTCLENPARSVDSPHIKTPKLSIIDGDLRHVSLPLAASQTSGCLVFWFPFLFPFLACVTSSVVCCFGRNSHTNRQMVHFCRMRSVGSL